MTKLTGQLELYHIVQIVPPQGNHYFHSHFHIHLLGNFQWMTQERKQSKHNRYLGCLEFSINTLEKKEMNKFSTISSVLMIKNPDSTVPLSQVKMETNTIAI